MKDVKPVLSLDNATHLAGSEREKHIAEGRHEILRRNILCVPAEQHIRTVGKARAKLGEVLTAFEALEDVLCNGPLMHQ